MLSLAEALECKLYGRIVPEEWNSCSPNNHEYVSYPEEEIRKVIITLDYTNCVFYQAGFKDILAETEGLVGTYAEWHGGKVKNPWVEEEEYNRFFWLVDEGEYVQFMQPIARIRTVNKQNSEQYWALLVAGNDGYLHKECANGLHTAGSNEHVATIYATEEDYEEDLSGKDVQERKLVLICPHCGNHLIDPEELQWV